MPGPNPNLAIYGCYYGASGTCSMGVTNIAPVGSAPLGNGKWGQSDLAGNVWEWLLDWYKDPYNELACTDCAYGTTSTARGFRGAGYFTDVSFLRSSVRNSNPPTNHGINFGARCARAP